MDISKCETCDEYCHMGKSWHEAAKGRMEAMKELSKCAQYWDSLFDDNDKPKITPERLNELVEADRDGRCVVLPCNIGDVVYKPGYDYPYIVESVEVYENMIVIVDDTNTAFQSSEIGKTVFLTREDSDAAMEGENK